jgi:exosortase
MKESANHSRLNALIFLATILLFAPTWFWLGEAWWSDPYYSHGPLVLLASLYFAWTQRRALLDQPAPRNLGFALVVVALSAHLWAMLWRAYYISALMIPIAILGLLVALYGWRIAQRFWFPLAFLILMIPLPLAERFGPALEGFAANSATALAQMIGIAARNDGAQVFLPNSTFTVGIPCGGLRSIIAIITLVVLLAYIVQGRAWARALIVIAAIPIAIAANTLRLALLFAIANFWGSDAAMNYFHDWSSPVLFFGAFALLLALAKLVGCDEVRWDVVMPGN